MVRLHVICEDGERGGRHENQFSIKSTDVSGFPGNACCSKKKKKKKVTEWFQLNQFSVISLDFYRAEQLKENQKKKVHPYLREGEDIG